MAKPAQSPSGLPPNWPNSTAEEIDAFGQRHVAIGEPQTFLFVDNFVKTSKYETYNFLPKFLMEEFNPYTKTANCYFLLISCLQCVPPISNTNGMPTTLIPLLVVILVDAIFQILEDITRHKADILANSSISRKYESSTRTFVDTKWSNLSVGDIICISSREPIPADCIILSTAETTQVCRGICYVDTKSLDGETNLKMRMAIAKTSPLIRSAIDIQKLSGCIEMEHPNKLINAFSGIMDLRGVGKFPVLPANVLLRGCTLRNTEWVIALVVNTGHDSKIMMSSIQAKTKQSGLEVEATKQIRRIIVFLGLVCFGAATGQAVLDDSTHVSNLWYLHWSPNSIEFWFIKFFYSMLLHATFIPVSLYVSMSLVRFYQSVFMNQDLDMYYAETDTPCLVRTMTLNEELGQISHIFSDKTGTLTRNVMDFRKASINGVAYGVGITEIGRSAWKLQGREIPADVLEGEARAQANAVPHVSFYCPRLPEDVMAGGHQAKKISSFFRVLAICHDIIPETHNGVTTFSANSPDDEALVYAAKYFDWSFVDRVEGGVIVCNEAVGLQETITLLETIEFSSKRKRMSVIIRDVDNQIKIFCKGADSVIVPRLSTEQDQDLLTLTDSHLTQYAREGLRCLLITSSPLTVAEFEDWHNRYQIAKADMAQIELKRKGEPNQIEDLEDEIERNLQLIGATAIEDRLQDGVPECIEDLVDAGLNIWILTGDKEETAINIGVACNLLQPTQFMVHIVVNMHIAPTAHAMGKLFDKEMKNYEKERANVTNLCKPRALIIDGAALLVVMADDSPGGLRDRMLLVCQFCKSVVCCRVSPDQKREIVSLIRNNVDDVRTLAIGDGANDVAMIQAAHVGVGISGVEGMQAVNSADYAIAQFRFLSQLVLKHGRYNYIRMGHVICYTFYKNVLMSMAQFWFNFNCLFSGQKYYTEYAIQLYNLIYSSIPILLLGIYDMDISSKYILAFPKMYIACINHEFFSSTIFWTWIVQAVIESVLLSVVPLYLLINARFHGQTVTFWEAGATTFTCIVIIINLKILFIQCRWYWLTIFTVIFSVAAWWMVAYVISSFVIMDYDWFEIFPQLLANESFWLTVILLVVVIVAKDLYIIGLDRNFNFRAHHILQEADVYKDFSTSKTSPLPDGVNLHHQGDSSGRSTEAFGINRHEPLPTSDENAGLYNVVAIDDRKLATSV